VLSAGASNPATAAGGGWASATGVAAGATAVSEAEMQDRRPSGGQWHWPRRRGASAAPRRRPRRSTRRWSHEGRAALRVPRGVRAHPPSCLPPNMTAAVSLTLTFAAGGGSPADSAPAAVVRQRRCGGRGGQRGVRRTMGDGELKFVQRARARAPHVRHACVDFESTSQAQGKTVHLFCNVHACIGGWTILGTGVPAVARCGP